MFGKAVPIPLIFFYILRGLLHCVITQICHPLSVGHVRGRPPDPDVAVPRAANNLKSENLQIHCTSVQCEML